LGRLGVGEEALEGEEEGLGCLELGQVTDVGEELEAGAGDTAVSLVGVGDGDEAVALAPGDEYGDGLGEVDAIEGADALTAEGDHRAQGGEEGGAVGGVGEL
jgi:hypothetical protein